MTDAHRASLRFAATFLRELAKTGTNTIGDDLVIHADVLDDLLAVDRRANLRAFHCPDPEGDWTDMVREQVGDDAA